MNCRIQGTNAVQILRKLATGYVSSQDILLDTVRL